MMKKRRLTYVISVTLLALVCIAPLMGNQAVWGANGKVKIKVWTINRADADYMTAMVNQFNKTHKNLEIDYQIYSDNYLQVLQLALATGDGPDVFMDGAGAFEALYPQGKLAPLDKYLTPANKKRFGKEGFIEGINVIGGKTYSLPAIGTTARLIYNKGIFKEVGIKAPPKSLPEMVRDAKLISDKLSSKGVYGFAQNLKSPNQGLSRSIDFILMRSGGVREGYDFKKGRYDFNGYKPILKAYREMFGSNAVFPGCESLDIDPLRTQFANGKIGMYISWTHSEPGVYLNQFPTKENWDIAQLPTIAGVVRGAQRINLACRWYLMNKATKHPQQAFEVLNFIYSDQLLSGYYTKGLGMVTVPSVLAKAKVPQTVKKWPALKFTKYDKVFPSLPIGVIPEGRDMYTVFAEIIFGQVEIDKGIEDLNTRYNAALEKAVKSGKTAPVKYANYDPLQPSKNLK
jgi:multiple sugar transport system substrate-binding protein